MPPVEIWEVILKFGFAGFAVIVLWRLWPSYEKRIEYSEQISKQVLEMANAVNKETVAALKQEREVLKELVYEVRQLREERRGDKR